MAPRGRDLAADSSAEPGSFRDHDSRVFVTPDGVYRVLSETALDDWRALAKTPLWSELQGERRVVATEPAQLDALPDLLVGKASGVLPPRARAVHLVPV